ncbi:Potassium transporter KimA [uncultured Gammaproteobacteria bacterium]
MALSLRRIFFGNPLTSESLEDQRLPKWRALPLFASDALSSVAYATEEILWVLVAAGSAFYWLSLPIALGIVALLCMLTASYWQTVHAYPDGGGAFIVAYDNLGEVPGLIAGAALLIDYVLTVAVSVSAGIRAVTSAYPALLPHNVSLCLVAVALITWANLRGIRESSTIFALPTYVFIALTLVLIGSGFWRLAFGTLATLPASSGHGHLAAQAAAQAAQGMAQTAGSISLLLLLRAFSSGCTAMTGVEAVSNGVQAFQKPESRNAGLTLVMMSGLLGVMFIGITILANILKIGPLEEESVLSQVAHAIFGQGWLYIALQAATASILLMAVNTSYTGFPVLASILSKQDYLPRQLANLGDRLAYSNGILLLAGLAWLLLVLFNADTHALVPLYAVGVFLSFTLSQAGMVVRWQRIQGPGWEAKAFINGFGALLSGIALIVLTQSKFTEGAWIIVVLVPLVLYLIRGVKRNYLRISNELSLRHGGTGMWLRELDQFRPKVVVPVSKIHRGTLAALHFARSITNDVTAVVVDLDETTTASLKLNWRAMCFPEPLVVLESPYRSTIGPLIDYLEEIDAQEPERGPAVVVVPYFIPRRWWQNLLHNQSALMLKAALMFDKRENGRARIVVDVPYYLRY